MLPVGADVEVYRYLHIMYERSRRKKRTRARHAICAFSRNDNSHRHYLYCRVTEITDRESNVRVFTARKTREPNKSLRTIDYVREIRITAQLVDYIRDEELSRLCFVNTQGVNLCRTLYSRVDIRRNTKS